MDRGMRGGSTAPTRNSYASSSLFSAMNGAYGSMNKQVFTWAAAWPRERRSRGSRRSTATAEASSSSSAAAAASGEVPPAGGGSSVAERRQTAGPVAPRGSGLAGSR